MPLHNPVPEIIKNSHSQWPVSLSINFRYLHSGIEFRVSLTRREIFKAETF